MRGRSGSWIRTKLREGIICQIKRGGIIKDKEKRALGQMVYMQKYELMGDIGLS